jgi:predicted ester cyclase
VEVTAMTVARSVERDLLEQTRLERAELQSNKRIVRQVYEEVRSDGMLDLVDELFDDDYGGFDPTALDAEVRGPEGFKEQTRGYRSVFPDLRFSIESIVAEGDEVVVRWSATGTHEGSLAGETPTGRSVTATGFGLWRIRGARIVEHWGLIDIAGLHSQLNLAAQA